MSDASRRSKKLKHFTGIVAVLLALALSLVANIQAPAHAAGSPPAHVLPAPAGGIDALHGKNHTFKHGVTRTAPRGAASLVSNSVSNPVYGTDPIIMVHGLNGSSSGSGNGGGGLSCTAGLWGFPQTYLQSWHPGLSWPNRGQDNIIWTGPIRMVGFYNGDWNCTPGAYISTNNNPNGDFYAPACNGVADRSAGTIGNSGYINNNDPRVGTNNEPLEHVACELGWYIYGAFTSNGLNVKILAHSMGGLIVRYLIEQIQEGDSHFPPFLYVSDVVNLSTPHGGLDELQAIGVSFFGCGRCWQNAEMVYDPADGVVNAFMQDIYNHDHPDAAGGTDWTMIGSLGADMLDWDYQATYMSNSNGLSNNHRIGYNYPISCSGQSQYPNGYDHGDYMDDQCDAYDAPYFYCDGCSRDKHTYFYYTTGAPHSLHEMLFAFVYGNW